MNAEKVLILGSRGFFGKNFISKFNSQVFYNDNLNLENYEELFVYLNSIRPTVVINCAGVVGSSIGNIDDLEIFERNNKILHNVFSVCSKFKTKLVVFSTYRVFGDAEQYIRDKKQLWVFVIKESFRLLYQSLLRTNKDIVSFFD
jgi:dTDP-4-dehydrorhamnose reductase